MTKWLSLLCAWGLVAQVGCAEAPAPAQREAAPVTRIGTHDSKWDAKTLEKHPSAERVDVALLLVDALKPNGKQKKSAVEIQKHDPVALEEMAGDEP